ncbi:C2H2 type zf-met: zinc-finger protein [Melia azedarach]|uniref:C2H2 type zf-met: zinc-finger protein n=1 Tax=Melia azedarach TaxID=155640 RepID=A0ACC1X8N1_MELAZ|nr:C2H2 type zf-met: zinc-finger protein [Melia azedarach]
MIKRRFYRAEHADRDDAVDSSSSSDSESELEAQATEESEDDAVVQVEENDESCSTSSGYESEDGSAEEINAASSGVIDEDDGEIGNDRTVCRENQLYGKRYANDTKSNIIAEKDSVPADFPDCVLQIKSVFRCKICPRVLCLTEETMRAHLNSKRHARSEKLLKEHRLKAILNDDGEIENQETAAELHARIVALAQEKPKKKDKRRRRKRNSSRKEEVQETLTKKKAKPSTHSPTKKRHKSEN